MKDGYGSNPKSLWRTSYYANLTKHLLETLCFKNLFRSEKNHWLPACGVFLIELRPIIIGLPLFLSSEKPLVQKMHFDCSSPIHCQMTENVPIFSHSTTLHATTAGSNQESPWLLP